MNSIKKNSVITIFIIIISNIYDTLRFRLSVRNDRNLSTYVLYKLVYTVIYIYLF